MAKKTVDYKRIFGTENRDDLSRILITLKETKSYGMIAKETGIPNATLQSLYRRLGLCGKVKVHNSWIAREEVKREDYLNDILPKAIEAESRKRGMSVDEFLEANRRGDFVDEVEE